MDRDFLDARSPTQFILSNPEILLRIFNAIPISIVSRSASVCKAWAKAVTLIIWGNATTRIFLSLPEAHDKFFESIRFKRQFTENEWDAFSKKCKNIRRFEDNTFYPCPRLHHSARLQLSNQVPSISLPNLVEISIGYSHALQSIVSSTVVKLTLFMTETVTVLTREQDAECTRHILYFLPNVKTLCFLGDERIGRLEDTIIAISKGMACLVKIMLSPAALTQSVMKCLGGIRTLHRIELAHGYHQRWNEIALPSIGLPFTTSSWPRICHGAFPALEALQFTASTPSAAIPFLSQESFPGSRLCSLRIRFSLGSFITSDNVRDLLLCIASTCENLEDLSLELGAYSPADFDIASDPPVLRYNDVKSFLRLRRLLHFKIEHIVPISMTSIDALDLAKNSSRFQTLWINPQPSLQYDIRDPERLPLSCLQHFAKHCPDLRRLGLHVIGHQVPDGNHPITRFEQLTELGLGNSTIPARRSDTPLSECVATWEAIGSFFARILPSYTEVTTYSDYIHLHHDMALPAPRRDTMSYDWYTTRMASTRDAWAAACAFALFLRLNGAYAR